MKIWITGVAILALLAGCQFNNSSNLPEPEEIPHTGEYVTDPHSFANPAEAVTRHLELDLDVDFDSKVISGVASYQISKKPGARQIVFDIDNLTIDRITLNRDEVGASYRLDAGNQFGQKLTVDIYDNTRVVNIYYKTSPEANAVQWLEPQQTAGKIHPFLFTQGQAILTRSWIPCQDSPGIRLTYDARVNVPQGLMALMSASNPTEKTASGEYAFSMKQPIPAYLIALAVGDIEFRKTGDVTGVYAEPQLVDAAAYEFAETPKMLAAAEKLYGQYRWDRYDVLVLPPSFPFGGMENPRLTFATPTIIAGDRSLTSLVAHELAHSWSGNLVTNASWNDFWLNEGFTVYFEKRIMEELYGRDYAEMLNMLGYQDLQHELEKLADKPEHTRLKLDLSGQDPDEGMTEIAYEKGYLFLRQLEETTGRERFDAFLRGYFDAFAFKTITTEEFVEYLHANLIAPENIAINLQEWIYGEGLPGQHPVAVSNRFAQVEQELNSWLNGSKKIEDIQSADWTTHEWLHFVRNIPERMDIERMAELDAKFGFTNTGNNEVKAAWFERSINSEYLAAYDEIEHFLKTVGRRKFLMPLYSALKKTPKGNDLALSIYARARDGYHSVSVRSLDELLAFDPEKYKASISL